MYTDGAGVTDVGTYQVQGNLIYFTPQDTGIRPFSDRFSLTDGALQLCDNPGPLCATYYQS